MLPGYICMKKIIILWSDCEIWGGKCPSCPFTQPPLTCICVKVTASLVASVDSSSGIIYATKGNDAVSPEIPYDGFGTDTDDMDGKLDKLVEVTELPIPAKPSVAEGLVKHFKSIINLYKYVSLFLLKDFLHLLFIAL